MEHWDIKSAFVNAPLEEEIYAHPVKGFEREGKEDKILKLKKALYGTKQAAHAWQKHLNNIFSSLGAKRNKKDECVFMWKEGEAFLFISAHVDDLFVLYNGGGRAMRDKVNETLKQTMEVTEKGEIESLWI